MSIKVYDSATAARLVKKIGVYDSTGVPKNVKNAWVYNASGVAQKVFSSGAAIMGMNTTLLAGANNDFRGYVAPGQPASFGTCSPVNPPDISNYPGATLLQNTANSAQVLVRVQGLTADPTKESLQYVRCAGNLGWGFLGETANYSYGSGVAIWTWLYPLTLINGQSYALSFQQKMASPVFDAVEMFAAALQQDDGDGGLIPLGNGFCNATFSLGDQGRAYPYNARGPNMTGRIMSIYTTGSQLVLEWQEVTGTVTQTGNFSAVVIPGFGTFNTASASSFSYITGVARWTWSTSSQFSVGSTYQPISFNAP